MFKTEINTNNEVFTATEPQNNEQVKRNTLVNGILKVCVNIMHGENGGTIVDNNGNKIGEWKLTDDVNGVKWIE